jgi:predicted alpha/beta hydrolase family esterase
MKQQILFIHGAGSGSHELDGKLAASIQRALGDDYQVNNPQMPSEGNPQYTLWKAEIARQLKAFDDPVILVGHSLGASCLMKYLSEETIDKPIAGLFMIATPYWDTDEYKLSEDFATHLPKGLPIFLYQGRDDQIVSFTHLAMYADKLPQANVRELEGRGHQLNDDLSEVAADILDLK